MATGIIEQPSIVKVKKYVLASDLKVVGHTTGEILISNFTGCILGVYIVSLINAVNNQFIIPYGAKEPYNRYIKLYNPTSTDITIPANTAIYYSVCDAF